MSDDRDQARRPEDADGRFGPERVKLRRPSSRPLGFPFRLGSKPGGQARRVGPPAVPPSLPPTPVRPAPAPVRPAPAPQGGTSGGQRPATTASERPTAPHPLARLRSGAPARSARLSGSPTPAPGRSSREVGLPNPRTARLTPPFSLADLRRVRVPRPGLRTIFAAAGLVATVALVVGLVVTLPTVPTIPAATGSVYQVNWRSAPNPPFQFDFGPYFTPVGSDLMMLGTTGSTTTVWSSSDGAAWSQVSEAGAFSTSGRRFIAQGFGPDGAGGLVAIGNSLGATASDVAAAAWHSRDGHTWSQSSVDHAPGQEMLGGVASKSGTVVTAGYGVAWTTSDGLHWSPQVLPGALNYIPRAVAAWDGGFVILGLWNGGGSRRSAAWYSPTGQGWTLASTSFDGFDVRGIATDGSRVVAVGSDSSALADGLAVSWSTVDGDAWVKATAPTNQPQTAIDSVTAVDGSFVAIGAADKSLSTSASLATSNTLVVWVSEDGSYWIPMTSSGPPVSRGRMATVGGRLVVVGGSSNGQAILTADVVLGPARAPTSSPSAPAPFALQLRPGASPMIVDVTANDVLGPVAATTDRFLVFVTQPTGTSAWASANGSLWAQELSPDKLVTAANNGRPVVLQAVSDGAGGIVAVGKITSAAGDTGTIWHQPKGGTWHQATLNDPAPPEFSSVVRGDKGFVVSSDKAGGSTVMFSANGETWDAAAIQVASGVPVTVATYQFGFIASGSDSAHGGVSTAWTSPDGLTWTTRTDWHPPLNVTAMFGMGAGVVAVTAGSGVPLATPAATANASAGPANASAGPATSASPSNASTWWWSGTGVNWRQSGLAFSGGNWAVANDRILAFDVPANATSAWAVYSSIDGKSWQRPGSTALSFGGSSSCRIASIGDRIVAVGWAAPGQLTDFFGTFSGS